MYLANVAPNVKVLRKLEGFLWDKCFHFLSGMHPYLAGIFSTADMSKFSKDTLIALYRNAQEGLPKMPSPPFHVISFLNKTQIQGQYNVRRALLSALHSGDSNCAMTLHMCFFPPDYMDPETLITSENQSTVEGSIFHSMVTLEQTG